MNVQVKVAIIGGATVIGAAVIGGLFALKSDNQPPVLSKVDTDKQSPQLVGNLIEVSAQADDPEGDSIRYSFWLKGPSNDDVIENVQNWSTQSSWEWRARQAGDYRIEVRVRDGNHADEDGQDDARFIYYEIASLTDEVIAESPEGRALEWIERGIALRDRGNWAEAVEAYDRAIEIDPKSEDALIKKGFALYHLQRYEHALRATEEALALNPRSTTALNNKSMFAFSLGDYDGALEAIDRAIELDPGDAGQLTNKCSFLYVDAVARYQEAVDTCDRAIQMDPSSALSWNHKGSALFKLERFEDALKAHEKATEVDPSFALAWYNVGTALFMLERYAEAVAAFERSIQIEPSSVAAHNAKRMAEEEVQKSQKNPQ